MNFKEFLYLLVKVDALNTFDLTDKERLAVLSTQIIKQILISLQIVPGPIEENQQRNAEDANDVFMRYEPFDFAYYDQPKIMMSRSGSSK